jgi:dTMP kinase
MTRPHLISALLISLAAAPASAQDVQRCEDANGRVSYASGPCPQGTTAVRTLPPAATPSAADRKAAQQRAQQDTRDAAAIDRARKAEEQRIAREQEQAQARAKKQEAQCRRLETRLRQEQDDLASAPSNKRAEAQRRVRRAEQAYVEECGPVK